jgi:hypothetical protein
MIDYLTLALTLPEHLWAAAAAHVGRGWQVQKFCPLTGEIEWSTACREVVRSDDHRVTIRVTGSEVTIEWSPARSMGLSNNVWGSDDLAACARAHLRLARERLDFPLPGLAAWKIRRVDVTRNYAFASGAEVRQAIGYLRQSSGGRYRADARREATVYWNLGSRLRMGKAYHKGPHLKFQVAKGQAEATEDELELAERLLRLELQLGSEWWRNQRAAGRQWAADLSGQFQSFFMGLVGTVQVAEMGELESLERVAPSKGQALAAYRTWALVKAIGVEEAQASMPRTTWYRHCGFLRAAGLTWADFATGQVVPFRRRTLVLEAPVTCWEDVRRAA